MKFLFASFLTILFFISSCQAQKLVQTAGDAKKLVDNKSDFVNQPLRKLLNEIKPTIKAALGNPENEMPSELPHISFYFTDKKEFTKREKNGESPTRIFVRLIRPNNKFYPKLNPNLPWTDEQTKIYGDMTVVSITILGKD